MNLTVRGLFASIGMMAVALLLVGMTAPASAMAAHPIELSIILGLFILLCGAALWRYQSMVRINRSLMLSITDHKRAEEALRIKDLVFDTSIAANSIANIDGVITEANDAFLQIWGYRTKDEVIGKPIAYFLDHAGEVAAIVAALNKHGKWQGNFTAKKKDGSVFIAYTMASAVRDGKGTLIGYQSSVMDITQHRQAEESLRRSEERFRQAVVDSPFPILLHAEDGAIILASNSWCEITGYTREELATIADWTELAYGKRKFLMRADIDALYQLDHRKYEGDNIIRTKSGGTRIWEFSSAPLGQLPDGRRMVMSMAMDVTDRRQAEEEKSRLEAQLGQSQKIEAIGHLAGGVAHDFNNMLSIINGYSEMLLREIPPTDPSYSRIQEIHQAGEHSANLTRQLLAFARKQTIAPKVLDLNDTITRMLKMLRRLIGENIELSWSPSAHLPTVKMDPSQINQILVNLLVNARDAIPGIGKVTIETGLADLDEAYDEAHLDSAAKATYVVLSITDNGCGMDQEVLGRIFEPFFTTKQVGEGVGLGLATVFGIVKQNDGFIEVHSEPGKGTTFKIYLPRHGDADPEKSNRLEPTEILSGTETVLLVEDEASLLQLIKTLLERLGYTVLATDNPAKAIELIREYDGYVHLLMTDVVMPEMSGRDLRAGIVDTHPDIKCLLSPDIPPTLSRKTESLKRTSISSRNRLPWKTCRQSFARLCHDRLLCRFQHRVVLCPNSIVNGDRPGNLGH